jgi:hypothetical protein
MIAQSQKPTSRVAYENLGYLEIRGSFAALAAQAVQLLLYTGTAIALARLLTPQDYGLFGIAFGIIAFLGIAKDAGLIAPVIQSQTLTRSQLDTLFWFTAAGGLLLTFAALAAAPLVGWLFSEARLVPVTMALALTLLAGGLSTQHRALLRRQMRFSTLASCEALAAAAGCAAANVAGLALSHYRGRADPSYRARFRMAPRLAEAGHGHPSSVALRRLGTRIRFHRVPQLPVGQSAGGLVSRTHVAWLLR